jgi:Ca2+-binding RTX toxin-like protein
MANPVAKKAYGLPPVATVALDGIPWGSTHHGGDTGTFYDGSAGTDTLLGWRGDEFLNGGSSIDDASAGATETGRTGGAPAELPSESPGDAAAASLAEAGGVGVSVVSRMIHSLPPVAVAPISGTDGDDEYIGDDGGNTYDGGGGSDTLSGGGGNDTLNGGSENDDIRGDGGNDSLSGNDGDDFIDGGDGHDFIRSGYGRDTLLGGSGFDTLIVDGEDHGTIELTAHGGAGNDRITVTSRYVTVIMTNGAVTGGDGEDSLFLDQFTDEVYFDNFDAISAGIEYFGINEREWSARYIPFYGDNGDNVFILPLRNSFDEISIEGLGGNDTLGGSNGDEERLMGGDGNDSLMGNGGNDPLFGGHGDDQIDGGLGADTANYSDHAVAVRVSLLSGTATSAAGNDTLVSIENAVGTDWADQLRGSNVANRLEGGLGDDSLYGEDGNDTLLGHNGDDQIDGGGGSDTANYSDHAVAVRVSLLSGAATSAAGNDTLVSIENAVGTDWADQLRGSNETNWLEGGYGDDRLYGEDGDDTLLGGEDRVRTSEDGDDTLSGGHGNDWLEGGYGNDVIAGGNRKDIIFGGDGDDLIDGGLGDDHIHGGARTDTAGYSDHHVAVRVSLLSGTATSATGDDTLVSIENVVGSDWADQLRGSDGANKLEGAAGADSLYGEDGDDTLLGGSGEDMLSGGHGIDRIEGGSGKDVIAGGNRDDTLIGGSGDDRLDGGLGDDLIDGGAGIDVVSYAFARSGVAVDLASMSVWQDTGGGGTDRLISISGILGSDFADQLSGTQGGNRFWGGGDADRLNGRGGTDIFTYLELSDSTADAADLIVDMTALDRIDVAAIDADTTESGNQAFDLLASATGAGEMELSYNANTDRTVLRAHVDDDGTVDLEIHFLGDVSDLGANWKL